MSPLLLSAQHQGGGAIFFREEGTQRSEGGWAGRREMQSR